MGLALSQPTMAEVGKGDLEMGLDATLTFFESDLLDVGGGFGLRGGYQFTDLFELEGQVSLSISVASIDTNLGTAFVNGVFNFAPEKKFVPYVLVGVGRADLDVEDNGKAYQVAGGVRTYGKRLGGRAEVWMIRDSSLDNSTHVGLGLGVMIRLHRGNRTQPTAD